MSFVDEEGEGHVAGWEILLQSPLESALLPPWIMEPLVGMCNAGGRREG